MEHIMEKRPDDNIRAMPTTEPSTSAASRGTDLIAWVEAELLRRGHRVRAIDALPSAASFRRFLRVHSDEGSCIAMDAPPERENNAQFVRLAGLFGAHGIPVPDVLACDLERGFLLVSDLGDRHLQEIYGTAAEAPALEAALGFVRIQSLPHCDDIPLPAKRACVTSSSSFPNGCWAQLGIELKPTERALLDAPARADQAMTAQPRCCVHRDYHCQNLLWRDGRARHRRFQDACETDRLRPRVAAARLLPLQRITSALRWRNRYQALARGAGSRAHPMRPCSQQINWTALQRQIKAISIFAACRKRTGGGSICDILPVMRRSSTSLRAPEHQAFGNRSRLPFD
jgi:aminoglycoside/choline kinase family phosphotransferase